MGYRLKWKLSTSTSWTTLASESNATKQDWSNNKVQAGADVGKTYDVLLEVFDSLMTVTSQYQIATATVPMSWGKNGTAIGKVYEEDGATFQVRGSGYYEGLLTTARDRWCEEGGSLHLSNSDMVGLNGLYFNDPVDTYGEGFMFPRTGTEVPPSGIISDNKYPNWDNLRVLDGDGFLNGDLVFGDRNYEPLWEGAAYMNDNQTVKPSKTLLQCPTGWVLQWSAYENGAAQNHSYSYVFVHKAHMKVASGQGTYFTMGRNQTTRITKYMYVSNGTITGHANNRVGSGDLIVLRRVFAF